MPKRILHGVVVSDKQEKTLVVKVERRLTHPLFKKTVRSTKNYHAHCETKAHKVGDTVSIESAGRSPSSSAGGSSRISQRLMGFHRAKEFIPEA